MLRNESVVPWSSLSSESLASTSAARLARPTRTVSPRHNSSSSVTVAHTAVPACCSSTSPCAETTRATAGSHRPSAEPAFEISTAGPVAQMAQQTARNNRFEGKIAHIQATFPWHGYRAPIRQPHHPLKMKIEFSQSTVRHLPHLLGLQPERAMGGRHRGSAQVLLAILTVKGGRAVRGLRREDRLEAPRGIGPAPLLEILERFGEISRARDMPGLGRAADHLDDPQRLALAEQLKPAERAGDDLVETVDHRPRGDDPGAHLLVQGLEPGGGVHAIADDAVDEPAAATHVADDRVAGIEADPGRQ